MTYAQWDKVLDALETAIESVKERKRERERTGADWWPWDEREITELDEIYEIIAAHMGLRVKGVA